MVAILWSDVEDTLGERDSRRQPTFRYAGCKRRKGVGFTVECGPNRIGGKARCNHAYGIDIDRRHRVVDRQ